jgi:putative addiction module component (TIGR02574 family)
MQMSLTADQIESEALSLPTDVRARIARALIESLDEDAEVERAWQEEIQRRLDDLRSGRVQGIPAEEVFAEIDALLR